MASTRGQDRIWATRDRAMDPPQRTFARSMRANPTDAERVLWQRLRKQTAMADAHFRRQVQLGRFIADFVSHRFKLIIEVDGGQHFERAASDAVRTKFFEGQGYRVLRYWNSEVLSNIDGVLEDVQRSIALTPTPDPSPQGGGE
jgi:very-short-patch-repair endonuclease